MLQEAGYGLVAGALMAGLFALWRFIFHVPGFQQSPLQQQAAFQAEREMMGKKKL
jgi:hypothetical protein